MMAHNNYTLHDPISSLISGQIGDDDKVNIRKVQSNIESQMTLF